MFIRLRTLFVLLVAIWAIGAFAGAYSFSIPQQKDNQPEQCNITPMKSSTYVQTGNEIEVHIMLQCNGDMVAIEGVIGQSIDGGPYFVNHSLKSTIVSSDIGPDTMYEIR